MKYKFILWDIDGTILNFLEAEKVAIKKGFLRLGFPPCTDEMIKEYSKINVKWWKKLERNECTKAETLINRYKEFFAMYNLDASKAEEFNAHYQVDLGDTVVFNDDAFELMKCIDSIHIGVTNGTAIAQRRKIKTSHIDELLDMVFISDEIGYEKPNKEFFEIAFKAMEEKYGKIDKKDIVIIGDSLTSDIRGGNNFNIDTIWYNPFNKAKDVDVNINYEIHSLQELRNILK